ncbi:MAG TPA: hypothetical protein VMG12_12275, partial [Polyangiaceae bacterium]|nr:hypothetical protein [Polyangiaceae bacterium]
PANDTFAPFPSPLRDLGAEGARKTLVGITPPGLLQSIAASAPPPRPAAPTPPLGAAPVATPRPVPGAAGAERSIEGAPCKPIETKTVETAEDFAAFDWGAFDGSRRPANPTVPFPRPRAIPRTATMPNPMSDETPDIGHASWHGTTTRTLRFVLTSPDHKPQRVAAALVCAAAALVIFAVGRSPIAGTAGIGQATESLSADPVAKPASAAAAPSLPSRGPSSTELAKTSGEDPTPGLADPTDVKRQRELDDGELAPGLVDPQRTEGNTRPASDTSSSDSTAGSAAKARPTVVPPAAPKPPPRKAPAPPPAPSSSETVRKNSTELDFGI